MANLPWEENPSLSIGVGIPLAIGKPLDQHAANKQLHPGNGMKSGTTSSQPFSSISTVLPLT
jgi:hypothetical protein